MNALLNTGDWIAIACVGGFAALLMLMMLEAIMERCRRTRPYAPREKPRTKPGVGARVDNPKPPQVPPPVPGRAHASPPKYRHPKRSAAGGGEDVTK